MRKYSKQAEEEQVRVLDLNRQMERLEADRHALAEWKKAHEEVVQNWVDNAP